MAPGLSAMPGTLPASGGPAAPGLLSAGSNLAQIPAIIAGAASFPGGQCRAALSGQADPSTGAGWISEMELADGKISARLACDVELGVPGSASSVLELDQPQSAVAASALRLSADRPELNGSVSCEIGASRMLSLRKGAFVFAPSVRTTLKTAFGKVQVDKGSVVLILSFAGGLAVYDLDDMHYGAVSVSAAGNEFKLNPGMNVVVTSEAIKTFAQVNPAQSLAYRNIARHEIGRGLRAFSAEFSVPGAIQSVLPLRQLLVSRHPNARKLAAHLLKTTAATAQVQARRGRFQQVLRPVTTAWVP